MPNTYIKELSYYEDLYDLITIRECLDLVDLYSEVRQEMDSDTRGKRFPKEEKDKGINQILNLQLLHSKAERYRTRKETLEKWVEEDRAKQDRYDTTPEPERIKCTECGSAMQSTLKLLHHFKDEPMRMLFFFECPKCKGRRGIYEDGEERIVKPELCTECTSPVTSTSKDEDDVLTITTSCPSCGLTTTQVDDFKQWREEREKKDQEDMILLAKFREEFCLSEEEGEKHVEMVYAIAFAPEVYEYEKQKFDDPSRDALLRLQRLNSIELEKLLTHPLEELRFTKLAFEKPEIGHYVVIPFTLQDTDSSRKGDMSTKALENLIEPLIEATNWRLMDGLSYRLGYVSGRLKGYEREEDLLKLTKRANTEPKIKAPDPEKLSKYGHVNVVKLARIQGEFDGTNNRRKRRLEKEPDGFFLEPSSSRYTCNICGQHKYGDEMWWDRYGQRCDDCRRNMLAGVIPIDLPMNHGQDIWIKDWEVTHEYGVSSTIKRKLKKEGSLICRDLSLQDGTTYCTIYVAEDNKEFLEEYPKDGKKK